MLIAALQEILRGTEKNQLQVLNNKYILQNVKDFLVFNRVSRLFCQSILFKNPFFQFLFIFRSLPLLSVSWKFVKIKIFLLYHYSICN